MRLLICLFASILLHATFFESKAHKPSLPSLSISLQPKSIDLKIRTRVKKKEEVSPEPIKEVQPPPQPEVKKKLVRKKKAKKKKPQKLKQKQKKPEPLPQKQKPKEYVSQQKEPRMIERAEYLSNPPPKYPKMARKRMLQGTVTLLVSINSEGNVENLSIQKSSGSSILDRAAKSSVSSWRFNPATVDGKQIATQVIVPIQFKLNR